MGVKNFRAVEKFNCCAFCEHFHLYGMEGVAEFCDLDEERRYGYGYKGQYLYVCDDFKEE